MENGTIQYVKANLRPQTRVLAVIFFSNEYIQEGYNINFYLEHADRIAQISVVSK